MFPEESVRAALDANSSQIMPVHWADFPLAQHHWKDPIERFVNEAKLKKVSHIAPRLGELVTSYEHNVGENWRDKDLKMRNSI